MHSLPHSLFSLRERELIRRVLDIPNMYILEFNEALKTLTPSQFWRLTRERFKVDGLVMGRDFHFGLNRAGNADYLARLARHDGLERIIIADLVNKPKYSSSCVRKMIAAGDVEGAREALGYPCFMMGKIIHGYQRGRTMNFPTANIDIEGRIIPADGVYCAAVLVNGEWHCGAVSVGNNPTFRDVKNKRMEVYILNFAGNIYGDEMAVFFLGRVRDMKAFADKDALMMQITRDTQRCREIYDAEIIIPETRVFLDGAKSIYAAHTLTPEIIRLV